MKFIPMPAVFERMFPDIGNPAELQKCIVLNARLLRALEYLFEETAPTDCSLADECFSSGRCGRGAYETPLDNAAGGCWFRECSCMSEAQQNAASILDEMDRLALSTKEKIV